MKDFEKFRDKKIGIIGFGLEGRSTLEHLRDRVSSVVVFDRNYEALAETSGDDKVIFRSDKDLAKYSDLDYFFKSPGVPYKNIEQDVPREKLTSQVNEFLLKHRDRTIAVTGTKGKSTTVTMIYNLLKNYGAKVELLGNIGVPVFESHPDMDYYVIELSSHQLELAYVSPKYGILLNIFEEHLDHYKSFEDYKRAKENIYKYQVEGDYLFSYAEPDGEYKAKYFNTTDTAPERNFLDLSGYDNIVGEHNKNNAYLAMKLVRELGLEDKAACEKTFREFKGLDHRLEYIGNFDGVDYYDDSISTIPMACILGAKSIENVTTIIIGGMDRNIDYSLLENFILERQDLKFLAMPDTGHKIARKILSRNVLVVDDLEVAVRVAKDITPKGRAVLLSPAAPSYGFFKNFKDRGEKFKYYVKELSSTCK